MSGDPVLVCAFDPVEELGNASGILALSTELAGRLIAEHRAEAVAGHGSQALRYLPGSTAYEAARQALREARAGKAVRARKIAKLEAP